MEFTRALKKAVSTFRVDRWVNFSTGLGGLRDKTTNAYFLDDRRLTDGELEAIFNGDDLAYRIVASMPEQALRQGFKVAEDEDGDLVKAANGDQWKLLERVLDAWCWSRLYGLGGIWIGIDGDQQEPLDLESIGEGDLAFLTVVDGTELMVAERNRDPLSQDYGLPETYQFVSNDREGYSPVKIHKSRFVFFEGARTTKRRKLWNQDRDNSVMQRCYTVLRDANTNWLSMVHMMQDASQAVFKLKGLISMIAQGQSENMQRRMELVNMARSVARAILIDADSESFENHGAQIPSDVKGMMETTWQRLAAASETPVTVLMGMSPAGLNATGESDITLWYDRIAFHQKVKVSPRLEVLLEVIGRHEGIALDSYTPIFPSLWQIRGPVQEAEYRSKVITMYKTAIDAGILFPEEVALGLYGSGQFDIDGVAEIIDLKLREAELKDPTPDPVPPVQPPPLPPGAEPPEDQEEGEEEPPEPPVDEEEEEGG